MVGPRESLQEEWSGSARTSGVTVLRGPRGIGRTTLLRAVAEEIAARRVAGLSLLASHPLAVANWAARVDLGDEDDPAGVLARRLGGPLVVDDAQDLDATSFACIVAAGRRCGGVPGLLHALVEGEDLEPFRASVDRLLGSLPDEERLALALLALAGRPIPRELVPDVDGAVASVLVTADGDVRMIRHGLAGEPEDEYRILTVWSG